MRWERQPAWLQRAALQQHASWTALLLVATPPLLAPQWPEQLLALVAA